MATRKESPLLHYKLLEQIGDGSFGSVHKAKTIATNDIVAIKIMKKKQNGSHLKECKTLKRMSKHPNIVQLYETFLGPTKDFYFVMEYVNGGNLYQFINERRELGNRIKSVETKSILYQILSALHHIHQVEGIFHRDMKPENLLMHYHDNNDVIIKLADFGLATEIKSKMSYTDYVSTRWYRAPEVLLKSSHYSFPIDLWAVGAIYAELVSLRPLFPGQSEVDQLFRICEVLGSPTATTTAKKTSHHIIHKQVSIPTPLKTTGLGGEWKEGLKLAQKMGFEFPKISPRIDCLSTVLQPHYISDDGIDLLTRLLQFDPSKRITSTEALKHPYFTNNNGITSPIITPAPTSAFFDLPIIPLSPFQIEEEYSQFNLLKRKSSIATSSVYNQPFADTNLLENNSLLPEENCSTLTRTSSFPNLYSLHSELDTRQIYPHHHHLCHHRHHEHGNTLQRSVSDLSIPFNNNNDLHHIITPSQDQKQQQPLQEKQKIKLKPINRFHFWGKKRITTT